MKWYISVGTEPELACKATDAGHATYIFTRYLEEHPRTVSGVVLDADEIQTKKKIEQFDKAFSKTDRYSTKYLYLNNNRYLIIRGK